jgi:hypothetical protein
MDPNPDLSYSNPDLPDPQIFDSSVLDPDTYPLLRDINTDPNPKYTHFFFITLIKMFSDTDTNPDITDTQILILLDPDMYPLVKNINTDPDPDQAPLFLHYPKTVFRYRSES